MLIRTPHYQLIKDICILLVYMHEMPFIFESNSSHRWIEICKVKIANYSSCKAAYANTLRNVDFRRSLLLQCASVELTLKCLVSVYPPPVLLSGHWQERQELIRRWDSERELLYDDNIHVQASAYAHWTDLLIFTFHYIYIYGRPILCK